MDRASSPVVSRQSEPHPRLQDTVLKHAATTWLRPPSATGQRAFDALAVRVSGWRGPLVLDTGCGTGHGTRVLARRHPDSLVIGLDKSEARLSRSVALPDNAILCRLDLEDFWPLALRAGWCWERQCFWYPNPWPKPSQRMRRWPFHPVFPTAVACGGVLEVRTNWKVYAQEFALAVGCLTGMATTVEPWRPEVAETLFERKYLASGHELWRCVAPSVPRANPESPERRG